MATIYESALNIQRLANRGGHVVDRKRFVQKAIVDLNRRRQDAGLTAHRSLIRTEEAFHLEDGLTMDELMHPHREFGHLILSGYVPRMVGGEINDTFRILMCVALPVVHGPATEIELELLELELDDGVPLPLEVRMDRPIYVPVDSAITRLAAA